MATRYVCLKKKGEGDGVKECILCNQRKTFPFTKPQDVSAETEHTSGSGSVQNYQLYTLLYRVLDGLVFNNISQSPSVTLLVGSSFCQIYPRGATMSAP